MQLRRSSFVVFRLLLLLFRTFGLQVQKRSPPIMEFECPVCYEDFQSPIYQCFNGHSLCKVCIDQVQSCPQCRDRLPCPRIRNTILEGQIASRASAAGGALIPCINASKGCKALMKPTRYRRHVGRCQLR